MMKRALLFSAALLLVAGVLVLAAVFGRSLRGRPGYPDRKLPIVVLKYGVTPDQTQLLEGSYGFLISWNDTEPPRFYVYDAVRWRIDATDDFDQFLMRLSALPSGIQMRWMTSCGGGFCYDMPDEKRQEVCDIWDRKGWHAPREEETGFSVICTCESTGIVFLDKAP